ncbi:cyclohexyl-isocyanide hydratase [Pseudarcicella hirudinis]|uniref:Cyclohexyl-isocyanide hydratase n=1 Tax=Pseudarcicella hirudinis TaxID=1079859 RepID=A0A1I5RYC8_9BACT|nr:DJ-1/PfpI family protein [Pseudarcicella hirudinis]SFP63470.1 cyclohexyl-isocyanide hydratase [Pseudarcicella hirudinis]
MENYRIGMLLFPELTLLDFVGPYDVFTKANCFEIFVVSENGGMIKAEGGLLIKADFSFEDCPDTDIIFVPGGKGITPLLNNPVYISFLQKQAKTAKYFTSVCTGSLLLATAGLLKGYRATTHWRSLELLRLLGIETLQERVVTDRNRITGGGVTAGIDFGLSLTALIGGEELAKSVQLQMEYTPAPPFDSGSPERAEHHLVEKVKILTKTSFDTRLKIIKEIMENA